MHINPIKYSEDNPMKANVWTEEKVMQQAAFNLRNEISDATHDIFTHFASVYYNFKTYKEFDNVDILNEKENLKLSLKKLGKKETPLTIKCDFKSYTTREYINYISHKVCDELLDYAMCKDIPLLVIQNKFNLKTLKVNCMTYQSNYDFIEMLHDYQPAKIILIQPNRNTYLLEGSILGIYLLDGQDNFIIKHIIQFIDEKNAPKGCKKLRVPKTVSEFYDSY